MCSRFRCSRVVVVECGVVAVVVVVVMQMLVYSVFDVAACDVAV